MGKAKEIWLETAFREFATNGPDAIKIDVLSGKVKKSRSSFYHYFGDKDIFLDELLKYHGQKVREQVESISKMKTNLSDGAESFVKHKYTIFFTKQLFDHRDEDPRFDKAYIAADKQTTEKAVHLWANESGLSRFSLTKVRDLYQLLKESFYARIDINNFTAEELRKLFAHINKTIEFLHKK